MALSAEKELVRHLLTDTILVLCKSGLRFDREMKIQGLLGVTLDSSEVVLVHIDETTFRACHAQSMSHDDGRAAAFRTGNYSDSKQFTSLGSKLDHQHNITPHPEVLSDEPSGPSCSAMNNSHHAMCCSGSIKPSSLSETRSQSIAPPRSVNAIFCDPGMRASVATTPELCDDSQDDKPTAAATTTTTTSSFMRHPTFQPASSSKLLPEHIKIENIEVVTVDPGIDYTSSVNSSSGGSGDETVNKSLPPALHSLPTLSTPELSVVSTSANSNNMQERPDFSSPKASQKKSRLSYSKELLAHLTAAKKRLVKAKGTKAKLESRKKRKRTASYFRCQHPKCGATFNFLSSVQRHTKEKHQMVRHQCPMPGCESSFSRITNLNIHLARSHDTWCDTARHTPRD